MTVDVTVLVPTFNHERYIAATLASVVGQTAVARTEIVVSDDCSTDRTLETARLAADGFPNVRVQKTEKNLGVMQHYRSLVSNIETEFIAILEGDDCWINARKLELQLRALERHSTVSGSFTACHVHDEASGKEWTLPNWSAGRSQLISFIDLLSDNPIATFSNCLYRRDALVSALERANTGYDWLVNLLVAAAGGLAFVGTVSTLYRVRQEGAWSGRTPLDKAAMVLQTLQALRLQVGGLERMYVEDAITRAVK